MELVRWAKCSPRTAHWKHSCKRFPASPFCDTRYDIDRDVLGKSDNFFIVFLTIFLLSSFFLRFGSLAVNQIGDAGAVGLGKGLATNTALKELK